MKRKHIYLGLAVVLVGAALWFARSGRDSDQSVTESANGTNTVTPQIADGRPTPGRTNAGPGASEADQTRRFRDFTPEQRVEQARKGHGPGG